MSSAPLTRSLSHHAPLSYSEALLRHGVAAFWRRTVGIGFIVAFLVAALGLGVLVAKARSLGLLVRLQPRWCWASRSPRLSAWFATATCYASSVRSASLEPRSSLTSHRSP